MAKLSLRCAEEGGLAELVGEGVREGVPPPHIRLRHDQAERQQLTTPHVHLRQRRQGNRISHV